MSVAEDDAVSETVVETGISRRGYWVRKGTLPGGDKEARRLKAELTMQPLQHGVGAMGSMPQTRFPLYLESRTKLYLPKYFGLQRYGLPVKERMGIGDGADVGPLRFMGSLRDEQRRPVEAFLAAARDPVRQGGILSMPCGFGKTVVALHLVARLGKKTLVVVHKDFLLNQWRERIAEFLPDARVGTIKAKTVDVADKDVVIASLQSLSMKDYPDSVLDGIGFVIFDECHRVGTEVFSRALHKTNFRYSLGISATVTRKDGMTKAFVHHLGEVLFQGKRRQDSVVVVQRRYRDADPAYCREVTIASTGRPNSSRMINNIAEHAPRTAMLVEHIARLAGEDRKVLVLSDRKRQLQDVRDGLRERDVDAGFYWGGMKREALAESEKKPVMCATFAYAAEGMDVPDLDTLVLASPKSDIEQSCGRILRKTADSRERVPLILDVVDCFSLFERQAAKRMAYYRRNDYRVVRSLDDVVDRDSEAEAASDAKSGGDSDDDRWAAPSDALYTSIT